MCPILYSSAGVCHDIYTHTNTRVCLSFCVLLLICCWACGSPAAAAAVCIRDTRRIFQLGWSRARCVCAVGHIREAAAAAFAIVYTIYTGRGLAPLSGPRAAARHLARWAREIPPLSAVPLNSHSTVLRVYRAPKPPPPQTHTLIFFATADASRTHITPPPSVEEFWDSFICARARGCN